MQTSEPVVLIGGGGFGREVLDVIEAINHDQGGFGVDRYEVVGVLADPAPDEVLLGHFGVKYLGGVDRLEQMPADVRYIIGIGNGQARRRIDEYGQSLGRSSPVLVHPSVTMGREVDLGPGTVVCSHVSLTNHITVGRHVHINLNCTVGHDVVVGNYVTLSPLVAVSGNVHLEDGTTVGTGAAMIPQVTVGGGATLGAGAVAVRDVPSGVTVVGVPAREVPSR